MPHTKLLAITLLAALYGCTSTIPIKSESVSGEATIEHDQFKGQTWIRTPLYLSRQGFTDTFPVQISWRALSKDNKTQFIQLYVTKMDVQWGFYHSASGEDGQKLDFVKMDGIVSTGTGMVTTTEHFALDVSHSYLEKMTTKDWQVKAYGRRNEGVFIVPAALSKGFLEKLTCFEAGQCK